ncbi:MAG TPA: hypothetical protein VF690_01675 [Hymenobacter sp.]
MSLDRLDQIANLLRQLPQQLADATRQVVSQNKPFLEDANTAQLAAGLDRDGQPITPEYAPFTVALKQLKGQPTDRVTLRDDGDFYTGIVAQLDSDSFEMVGTDQKTPALVEKYGDEVLGLTADHIEEFRDDYVRPELELKTREFLGL